MTRRGAILFASLLSIHATKAMAAPTPLVVSGSTTIAILDGNDDGPGAPPDCSFSATFDPNNGALLVAATQDFSNPLQGCSGNFMGNADAGSNSSEDFFNLTFNSSTAVGTVLLPTAIAVIDEAASPPGPPLDVNKLEIVFGSNEDAGGLLCSVGAPIALVRTTDGTRLAVPLEFFPSFESPSYLKVPNLPVSNVFGETQKVDGYIPVTSDRRLTVQLQGSMDLIVDADLDELAPCPGGVGVPTTTLWGLIGLMLGLLALGAWAVGRRPGIERALPL